MFDVENTQEETPPVLLDVSPEKTDNTPEPILYIFFVYFVGLIIAVQYNWLDIINY